MSVLPAGPQSNADWAPALFVGHATAADMTQSVPSPLLRKDFAVAKTLSRARLFATALGFYRAFLNGQRIGDQELAPGWTDFGVVRHYQTYDVTTLVATGSNALALELGDGLYCGNLSIHQNGSAGNARQYYGPRPFGLALLVLEYADGTSAAIGTDGTWKATTGPILASDLYNGETYDARLEADFSLPTTSTASWAAADTQAIGAVPIIPQPHEPVRRQRVGAARQILSPATGVYLFDFGTNAAGRCFLTLRGLPAGITLQLRHGEALKADGTLYVAEDRLAVQTDRYTTAGSSVATWEPAFTQHGFRYAELTGWPLATPPPLGTLARVTLHADFPTVGSFACSDPVLSRVWQMTLASWRSNSLLTLSDCDQRDERMGWTDDGMYFGRTATLMTDCRKFLAKWARDIDGSYSAGYGSVAPYVNVVGRNVAGWGESGVYIPWLVWTVFGDAATMTACYPNMRDYVLNVAPGHNDYGDYWGDPTYPGQVATDPSVFIPAFAAHAARCFMQMATALGNNADASAAQAKLTGYLGQIAAQVAADGTVGTGSQCNHALVLGFGLAPSGKAQAIADKLAASVAANGFQVGFHGLARLLPALAASGHQTVAYQVMQLPASNPVSFARMIAGDQTTTTEVWDAANWIGHNGDQANSLNHFARGAVCEWMMRSVAGIDADPTVPGSTALIMAPQPGGGLTFCRASWMGVRSAWTVNGTAFTWVVTFPAGSTATLTVPGQPSQQVAAGTYTFTATLGN